MKNTPWYSTIQEAIDATGTDATILVGGESYDEDVSLGTPKNLTLKAGYDSTFITESSETTLHTMTISDGCAVGDKFILQ